MAARTARGKTVYYAPWAVRDGDVPALAALSDGKRGRIVRLVNQEKTITQSGTVRALPRHRPPVLLPLRRCTDCALLSSGKAKGRRYSGRGETYARLRSDS